jgi:hypothetical protein
MKTAKRLRWVASLFLASGLSVLPLKHVQAQGIQIFIEEPSPPPDLEEYPHVVYEGQPVYYVHGRWYYRHGPRWVYYRDPPPRLRERHEHEMIEAERAHDAQLRERDHRSERAHDMHEAERAHDMHEAERARDTHEADRSRTTERGREAPAAPPPRPAREPERGHDAREERKPEAARSGDQHNHPDPHARRQAPPAR